MRKTTLTLLLSLLAAACLITGPANSQQTTDQAGGKFDGPAELPRVYIKTTLADTPAPGKKRLLKDADDLQDALKQASCGDTIQLQAGAAFSGKFTLPAKDCDDSRWIIVRTSAPDSALPPEGTRLTPCYAGVTSLPARPPLNCKSTQNVLAKIVTTGKGNGPLIFADGASHYRFIGLEITRDSPGVSITHLIGPDKGAAFDHIIFDRVWIHGTSQDETARGIQLGASQYFAVVDSTINDFHCVAVSGTCTDSQALSGGHNTKPMGPYKIVNNFLEGAGETIIFGGAPSTMTPTDIEIRRNYMFKPMIWKKDDPNFVGGTDGHPFIVKNLFELKNAQRVLLEGNIMENTWGGFSQTGYGVLLTPKNQSPNVCPLCRVTDVTIRYNRISHVASCFQIANALSDTGGPSSGGERYSIHDIVCDDMDKDKYKGLGIFAQVSMARPTLRDLKIDHVTAFPTLSLFDVGAPSDQKMENFTFTNSIVSVGRKQISSTGGKTNCAVGGADRQGPGGLIENCFSGAKVTNNILIDGGGWPKGNFHVGKPENVGFVNFNDGNGGDYRLSPKSKFKKAGTDGKDPGADMDALESATAGVR
jgi:hypothetical protein